MMLQGQLFSDEMTAVEAPDTEGIKYAGSKLKLIPQILQLAARVRPRKILDGFSGTTRVSQAFAKFGYEVVCNDVAVWSKVFATCYLKGQSAERYHSLIRHLNEVKPRDGWFTEFYGGDPAQKCEFKKPWQIHNTRKLDGIREEIDSLSLDPVAKCVALTSLILALDQVDSTLGHFVSYLREWSPRSYNSLNLRVPAIIQNIHGPVHSVHQSSIFELAPQFKSDLAYFDPPYGSNNEKMPPSRVRYASYYHIWTTICLNDKPALFGKANRRVDSSDTVAASPFEDFRKESSGKFIAVQTIKRLLEVTNANFIILSYSSGGRATSEELNGVIKSCGNLVQVMEIDYKRNVMAGMKWTNEWLREAESPNREFLFLIEKS
jgi:adenine-specific DNA-methyltransferase